MKRLTRLSSILFLGNHLFCNTNSSTNETYPFITTKQYRANNPIEDRITYTKLNAIRGYTFSVFDGHGGDLVAQFASQNLNQYLQKRLQENLKLNLPIEQIASLSISQAYNDVQYYFFMIFKQNINQNPQYRTVGACALTTIVLKNSIIVGNAGDCEGLLIGSNNNNQQQKQQQSNTSYVKINQRLNAGQPSEQERLRKQFPNEKDIIKCIKNTNYCYVKGRLQPTRSLGDYYLKKPQFNFTKLSTFTGPYIDFRPLITHFPAKKTDKYLVLASDGMWDELTDKEVNQIVMRGKNSMDGAAVGDGQRNTAEELFDGCLEKIKERNNVSFEKLEKISNRREMHDDISIVAVDLQKLRETL